MTIAEQSLPPKRHSPRKPRKRKIAGPPRTFGEAILRLVGPLWGKWYGTPIILLVLLSFGVWRTLSEGQQRAVLASVVAFYDDMSAVKYDVAIDDLDLTRVDKSADPYLSFFRPVTIQLQRSFDGTRNSTFVNDSSARIKSSFTLTPSLTFAAPKATVTLALHDARGGLVAESQIAGRIDFFKKIRGCLGSALLHALDFDKYTLARTHPLARRKVKPDAYALFLAAQDLESGNQRARPEAIELMKEAVERDENFATGYFYLAALLKREGRAAEATANENHANELDPDHPQIDDFSRNPVPRLLDASEKVQWERLNDNIELKVVHDRDYDIHVFAWRVDPTGVTLKLVIGKDSKGEDVQEIRRRENAILAVNAGWFSSDNQNYLSPEYALKVGGTIFNPYRGEIAGGALAIEGGGVKILTPQHIEENLVTAKDLVYSKPVMLEPGRKFAMIYNDYDRRSRTAVCTTPEGKLILLVVTGNVSLYELAQFLSDRYGRQGLPCDAALALTGGPVTQASFALGERSIDIQGRWPVYDALVVSPR
jgi:tetratricopeptide (TPR) repeat protein